MTRISGRTALVTGGQRGLGRAFVDGLLARGATRVYATARDPRAEQDPRIVALPLDVTDPGAVETLAERAADATIVVNNAGVLHPGSIVTAPMDDVVSTFETNVFGALRIAQRFAPVIVANGGGALVDLHSVLSWASGAGAYGASKAALWSLTNSLRAELAPQGVQVLGVHLGFADTEMVQAVEAAKIAPAAVADAVLDGLERGEDEVLVDEPSRRFKAALSGPVRELELVPRSQPER